MSGKYCVYTMLEVERDNIMAAGNIYHFPSQCTLMATNSITLGPLKLVIFPSKDIVGSFLPIEHLLVCLLLCL